MARPTLEAGVKFKMLVKELNIPKPYVRGLLETKWDVCHATGDPILGNDREVEVAAEWPGDPGVLFEALRAGRWIDETDDGRWMVHDYWQHCPDYVLDRLQKELGRRGIKISREEIRKEARENPQKLKERLIESRTRPRLSETFGDSPRKSSAPAPVAHPLANNDQPATASGGDPSSSQPSKRKPKRSDRQAVRRWAAAAGFSDFWEAWPDKKARLEAEAAFVFDLEDEDRRQLVERTADYLLRRDSALAAGRWVPNLPNPASFIRGSRWEDSFEEPNRRPVNPVAEDFRREGIEVDGWERPS